MWVAKAEIDASNSLPKTVGENFGPGKEFNIIFSPGANSTGVDITVNY